MSGPTAPGLFEWPQDVHKRSQDTIPTIFGCKRAILQKPMFSWGKPGVCDGRVAKLRNEHPPFFALRPPPRAIWTDVRSSYPWETPLPHSTKKPTKCVFWFFCFLLSVLCSLSPFSLRNSMISSATKYSDTQLLLTKIVKNFYKNANKSMNENVYQTEFWSHCFWHPDALQQFLLDNA